MSFSVSLSSTNVKSDNELGTVDGISSLTFIARQYFYGSNLPFAAEEQFF